MKHPVSALAEKAPEHTGYGAEEHTKPPGRKDRLFVPGSTAGSPQFEHASQKNNRAYKTEQRCKRTETDTEPENSEYGDRQYRNQSKKVHSTGGNY